MRQQLTLLPLPFLLWWGVCFLAQAQNVAPPQSIRIVVGAPSLDSTAVLAIPPATSWKPEASTDKGHPIKSAEHWISDQRMINGLQNSTTPWHIVIDYEQFDATGQKVHSGTYEETWAGPARDKVSYQADDLNETNYSTSTGLFRVGDQQGPNRAQVQVPKEVLDPFFDGPSSPGLHLRKGVEAFGSHALDCALAENSPGTVSVPVQYCFDPDGSTLRYSQGPDLYQTTYNDLTSFDGRSIARLVTVYDAGLPYLKLSVRRLQPLSQTDPPDLTVPADAKSVANESISGSAPRPIEMPMPDWPDSVLQQHFSVQVDLIIGKNGKVLSAHAVSGPMDALAAAEAAARKWTYKPFMVRGQAAESTFTIVFSNYN